MMAFCKCPPPKGKVAVSLMLIRVRRWVGGQVPPFKNGNCLISMSILDFWGVRKNLGPQAAKIVIRFFSQCEAGFNGRPPNTFQ